MVSAGFSVASVTEGLIPGPLAVGAQHGVLEHAREPARHHVGVAQIGVAEREQDRAVVLPAGEVGVADEAADEAGRIHAGAAVDRLVEREARERQPGAALARHPRWRGRALGRTRSSLNSPVWASIMPLHSIDLSRRLSAVSNARIRMNGTARSSSTSGSRARTKFGSFSASQPAPSTATGRSRKRASSDNTREEGVDRARGEAVADDDAVDLAGLETGCALIDAERADHAHALADRDAQRRMMAAAADQQHGRIVERIAGRQFGHDVALVLERLGAAEHGRMQRAQPQRR